MSSASGERSTARVRTPAPVRIVNWPLRDDGVWAWMLASVFLGFAALAGRITGSLAMALIAFLILALAAWRLWFPVTFELGAKGIVQTAFGRSWRIPWNQIARYETRQRGVLLFADLESTPLSPLRGLYVRWNGQRDELLRVIQFFVHRRSQASIASTRSFDR